MSKQYAERIPGLLDEEPISFYPNAAVVFGVNEAIVLQQIYFYMNINRKKKSNRHLRDGKWWVYNSYQQWIDEHFPWLSLRGLQTVILGLEKCGVILSMQGVENPRDRRKWYTIDLDTMHTIIQNRAMHHTKNVSWDDTKNVPSNAQEMCDEYTESTTEKTTEKKLLAPAIADRADTASASHNGGDVALNAEQIPSQAENVLPPVKAMSPATAPSPSLKPKSPTAQNTTAPIPHSAAPLSPADAPVSVDDVERFSSKLEQDKGKKPAAKRSERQLINDALVEALRVAFFKGRGKEPVELGRKEFSNYLKVAQDLVGDGVPSEQFLEYVQYWNRAAQSWPNGLTLNSLTTPGRISDFKSWYASRTKNAISGDSRGSQVSTTPNTAKRGYDPRNDPAYAHLYESPQEVKQAK
jgi:hypothetical protein